MRNLTRLTNAANNFEAQKAFRRAIIIAIQYSISSPLLDIDPATMGWRKLDKATEAIMDAINNCGANPPISWDNLFEQVQNPAIYSRPKNAGTQTPINSPILT